MDKKDSDHYFKYDASFRIGGVGNLHDEIAEKTGISLSYSHRKGELRSASSKRAWDADLWMLQSPLNTDATLDEHVQWLWEQVETHKEYFRSVLDSAEWGDLCVGCRSDCSWPMIGIESSSLAILRELKLSITFNFTID